MESEFGESQQEIGFSSDALESEPNEEHRSIPCQCLSDMIPDFKRALKNISEDITELSKLNFMSDTNPTDIAGQKLTALDVLWKQVQKGKFAHDNIEPLECLLKDIDRCDLASKHIQPYKQKYGEHTTSGGPSSRKITSPARSIRRTPSAQSLPVSSSYQLSMQSTASPNNSVTSMSARASAERQVRTDPGSQRNRIKEVSRAKVQKHVATKHSHRPRCTTVPEEESSTSLQLSTSSLRPNIVPSFQPQSHVRAGQNWSDTQSEVCLSHSRNQTPSSINALSNAAVGMHSTQTRPGRSPSYMRPSSSLSVGDDLHWRSQHRSLTPRDRESVSTPASEQWSGNLHDSDIMEAPSISLSELEESGEYNQPSLPCDMHSRCSTAASGLSYPCIHTRNYPHSSEAALSACSNPYPLRHHSSQCPAHSSCCSLPAAMMQSPLYLSPHSAFQCPGQHHHRDHMASSYQYRKQGACRSGSSTQPPKIHTEKCSWAVTRKCLMKGMEQHGKPLKKGISFTLPIGCKKKNNPKVYLSVIPCESRDSRHVVIEGEFLIPRNCSRHKWLVEYCDCSVCLSIKVINPKNNNVLGEACGEFAIAHNEINRDHRTHMKLDKVLEHKEFLYSDACVDNFDFHATVQLFELECRLDNTVQYECKESDFDFTEISLLSVPSQVASSHDQ